MKRRKRAENHCRLLIYKKTRDQLRELAYWLNEDMITVIEKLVDKAHTRQRRKAPPSP